MHVQKCLQLTMVHCNYNQSYKWFTVITINHTKKTVTRFGKTSLIGTITETHFLSVSESRTHALPRNTKYVLNLIMDGHVYFHRRLFADAVEL